MNDVPTNKSGGPSPALAAMFSGADFVQVGKMTFKGKVNGLKSGIAVMTYNGSYHNYVINKNDLDTVREPQRSAIIDAAYCVYAKRVGGKFLYVAEALAEEIYEKVKDVEPLHGPFGDFWTLPPPNAEDDWAM